jgi:hypothetical protein
LGEFPYFARSEDAAVAERAGPKLKRAFQSTRQLAGGQIVSSLIGECTIIEFLNALATGKT